MKRCYQLKYIEKTEDSQTNLLLNKNGINDSLKMAVKVSLSLPSSRDSMLYSLKKPPPHTHLVTYKHPVTSAAQHTTDTVMSHSLYKLWWMHICLAAFTHFSTSIGRRRRWRQRSVTAFRLSNNKEGERRSAGGSRLISLLTPALMNSGWEEHNRIAYIMRTS